jgi:hypothetical protein
MGIEGEPPTPEQVAYIRNKVNSYIDENGQGNSTTVMNKKTSIPSLLRKVLCLLLLSNYVVTNSSRPASFVRYNRVSLCT